MSPEQTGRINRSTDARSDLYSLGVSLYEMLTGSLPFPSNDPLELLHSHIARKPPPPTTVRAEIPSVIADIVLKLLGKMAEDRYQSALGLRRDLEECLAQLERSQPIVPFPLARHDQIGELRLPQRLFGRGIELSQLQAALERTHSGALELVLLSGPSGVGKSALAAELLKSTALRGDYLVRLRFEESLRSIPYEPLLRALRGFLRQVLTEPSQLLAQRKTRLLELLNGQGRILIELLPELESIIGPQPEVPGLAARESQNRFELLFQRFLSAFASGSHALVLLAEELQYADSASLHLIEQLFADPYAHYLLVVGTYRPTDVQAGHPLALLIDALRRERSSVTDIPLKALARTEIAELLSATLSMPGNELEELATAVLAKTHGNPFFVHQFIKSIFRQKALSYNDKNARWEWDLFRIQSVSPTDNVSDFMIDLLRALPESSQKVLKDAACIGTQFDLQTLLSVSSQPAATCLTALSSAVNAGLLAPLHSDYRFIEAAGAAAPESTNSLALSISFKFLHARLQQAACEGLSETEQQDLHLKIGRLQLGVSAQQQGSNLFEAVSHLNRGCERLRERKQQAELLELAKLNLTAGLRAKSTAAVEAASAFFAAGARALSDASWSEHEELLFSLHLEHAHCTQLCGQLPETETLLRELQEKIKSPRHQALLYLRWCELCSALGDFNQSLSLGLKGLICMGEELLPDGIGAEAAIGAESAMMEKSLAGRSITMLLESPVTTSEDVKLAVQLLIALLVPSYMIRSPLYPVIVTRMINIALRAGVCEETSYACAVYSFLLCGMFGRPKEGAVFAEVAQSLNRRLHSVSMACRVAVAVCATGHFNQPLRELLAYTKAARQQGLASGDFNYLGLVETNACSFTVLLTDNLAEALEELNRSMVLVQRAKDAMSIGQVTAQRQFLRALLGRTDSLSSLNDADYDEAAQWQKVLDAKVEYMCLTTGWTKLRLLYLAGRYEEAAELTLRCEPWLNSGPGLAPSCDMIMWSALALLARMPAVSDEVRAQYETRIEQHHQMLRTWAGYCAANYLHRERLVAAERARIAGKTAEAILLYDEAIDAAQRNGYPLHEILAHELAGRFYASINRSKLASFFLTEAFYAYLRIGTTLKSSALLDEFPEMLRAETRTLKDLARPDRPTRVTTSSVSSNTSTDHHFDVNAVLRAAEVISRELTIDKVIEQVLLAVMSSAGAQRGFLILDRNGTLQLEASRSVTPDSTRLGIGIPIERSGKTSILEGELALSVVHYVVRSREVVAISSALMDSRFATDPYVISQRPKAVLCMPLLHQGRLTGVLYLENNLAELTFTTARIDLLRILSVQASTALENALLLHRVQEATEKVKRTNELLEAQVMQRTNELQRNNADLETANKRLLVELTERARAERERGMLQEQMLQAQRERLSELSTPIIPITDSIMVMPLIGSMDSERADQMLEAALHGAQQSGAQVVILDITGLRHMDTSIAGTLIKTARALRLLGAQAILTGIRSEVAQTLVSLGIDLQSIESRSTLQSGIASALTRVGSSSFTDRKRVKK